jgi:hypothetical protein
MALRSLLETVACQHLIGRRKYVSQEELDKSNEFSHMLFGKLQAMRRALGKKRKQKYLAFPISRLLSPINGRSSVLSVPGLPSTICSN